MKRFFTWQETGFIAVGGLLIVAVLGLYKVAPCWTFDGWDTPQFFYRVVWPLIVPAVLLLSVFSGIWAASGKSLALIIIAWLAMTGTILYGWYDGYLATYFWWKSTPGAPWPLFC